VVAAEGARVNGPSSPLGSVLGKKATGSDVVASPTDVRGPYAMVKEIGKRIQAQYGGLSLLMAKANALEIVLDKIRSDPAKIAINELLSAVAALADCREEITKAYKAAAASARSAEVKHVAPAQHSDAVTQSPCWWDQESHSSGMQASAGEEKGKGGRDSEWTDVVKNKPRGKRTQRTIGPSTGPDQTQTRKAARPSKNRPPAIIVRRGDDQFPELLRTVRSKTNVEMIGTSISEMREMRNGGLLIEVNGGVESAELVRLEVEQAMGPRALVRKTEKILEEGRDT